MVTQYVTIKDDCICMVVEMMRMDHSHELTAMIQVSVLNITTSF